MVDDTIDVTITTRAAKIQSGKFKPFVIQVPKTSTLAGFRRLVGQHCHRAFNMEGDIVMDITFKEVSKGLLFTSDLNDMKIGSLVSMAGTNGVLALNMCLDGYGEGGGKRVSLTGYPLVKKGIGGKR